MVLHFKTSLLASSLIFASACNIIVTSQDERSDSEDTVVAPPSSVTGSYLTYHNARLRCANTMDKASSQDFKVTCRLVALNADGSETVAFTYDPSLKIDWGAPEVLAGSYESLDCDKTKDELSFKCSVSTQSLKLKFHVGLKFDGDNRFEVDEVLFPYSVGIAAGHVPSMGQIEYAAANKSGSPSVEVNTLQKFGLQRDKFTPFTINSGEITSFCSLGSGKEQKVFYTIGEKVYALTPDGWAVHFAGQDKFLANNNSHRLRIRLDNPRLYCAKDQLIIFEVNRFILLDEILPPKIIPLRLSDVSSNLKNPLTENAFLHDNKLYYLATVSEEKVSDNYTHILSSNILDGSTETFLTFDDPKIKAKIPTGAVGFKYLSPHYPDGMILRYSQQFGYEEMYSGVRIDIEKNVQESLAYQSTQIDLGSVGQIVEDDSTVFYTQMNNNFVMRIEKDSGTRDKLPIDKYKGHSVDKPTPAMHLSFYVPYPMAISPATDGLHAYSVMPGFEEFIVGNIHSYKNGVVSNLFSKALNDDQEKGSVRLLKPKKVLLHKGRVRVADGSSSKLLEYRNDGSVEELFNLYHETLFDDVYLSGGGLSWREIDFAHGADHIYGLSAIREQRQPPYQTFNKLIRIDGKDKYRTIYSTEGENRQFYGIAFPPDGSQPYLVTNNLGVNERRYKLYTEDYYCAAGNAKVSRLGKDNTLEMLFEFSFADAALGTQFTQCHITSLDVNGRGDVVFTSGTGDVFVALLKGSQSYVVRKVLDSAKPSCLLTNCSYKEPDDRTFYNQVRWLSDSEIFVVEARRSNLFKISYNTSLRELEKPQVKGAYKQTFIFGKQKGQLDCGAGVVEGKTTLQESDSAIRASLTAVCAGVLEDISVINKCATDNFYELYIAQTHDKIGNILKVEAPCQ